MQESFLKLMSLGTIGIFIGIFAYLLLEIFRIKNPIKSFIIKNQLVILFFTSLIATAGSLSLSIYFKLAPCELCWYQRVFLFTTPIIAWLAVYKNDLNARLYIFILSIFGASVALYHALIQSNVFKGDSIFCNPVSAGVDCSVPVFVYYGFVTVPVISLAVFGLMMILSYKYKNNS